MSATLWFLFSRHLQKIKSHTLLFLAVIIAAIVFGGGTAMWFLEREKNEAFKTVWDGFWFVVVTLTTVGYGDKFPVTGAGRIVTTIIMLSGIGLLAVTTGEVAIGVVERSRKARRGLHRVRSRGHVIVCGWNGADGENLIKELLGDITVDGVVIIAELLENPIDHPNVKFVAGSPSKRIMLERANIEQAKAALILAKDCNNPDSDGKSALIFSAVRKLAPDIHIGVEVIDPSNEEHFPDCARINTLRFGTNLLVQSIVDQGVEMLLAELVSNQDQGGSTIYRMPVPGAMVGKRYAEVLTDFFVAHNILVVGRDRDGACAAITTIDRDERIEHSDSLFVLALLRPSIS